jgi:HEAT repeat protein
VTRTFLLVPEINPRVLRNDASIRKKKKHVACETAQREMNKRESELLKMDLERDLSFIEFADLTVPADLLKVRRLAGDKNAEVRYRALEKLGQDEIVPIQEELRRAVKDEDEIVRVEAIEIISFRKLETFLNDLIGLTEDSDEIVRAAAAGALGSFEDFPLVSVLENIVRRNLSELEIAEARFALAKLDPQNRNNWLSDLLTQLSSENYLVRCRVANLIGEIEFGPEVHNMLSLLIDSLKMEKTEAARSSIQKAINKLTAHSHP